MNECTIINILITFNACDVHVEFSAAVVGVFDLEINPNRGDRIHVIVVIDVVVVIAHDFDRVDDLVVVVFGRVNDLLGLAFVPAFFFSNSPLMDLTSCFLITMALMSCFSISLVVTTCSSAVNPDNFRRWSADCRFKTD